MISESMIAKQNGNGHAVQFSPADYRHNCGRLLFRGLLTYGSSVQIRCPKCGVMAVFGYGIDRAEISPPDDIDITEISP